MLFGTQSAFCVLNFIENSNANVSKKGYNSLYGTQGNVWQDIGPVDPLSTSNTIECPRSSDLNEGGYSLNTIQRVWQGKGITSYTAKKATSVYHGGDGSIYPLEDTLPSRAWGHQGPLFRDITGKIRSRETIASMAVSAPKALKMQCFKNRHKSANRITGTQN